MQNSVHLPVLTDQQLHLIDFLNGSSMTVERFNQCFPSSAPPGEHNHHLMFMLHSGWVKLQNGKIHFQATLDDIQRSFEIFLEEETKNLFAKAGDCLSNGTQATRLDLEQYVITNQPSLREINKQKSPFLVQ